MPFKASKPAGGFRVMYEYANRLSELGYSVHITYPLYTKYMQYRLPYFVRYIRSKIEGFRTNNWFSFNPKITRSYVNSIREEYVIDADIIIVTWWTTVTEVGSLSKAKGKKINLIQGYEDWEGHVEELYASYNLSNTYNVVVAKYLIDIVKKHTDKNISYIPNAINKNIFCIRNNIKDRDPKTICMLYSIQEIKGSTYGLKALYKLHKKYSTLKVDLFGICPEPKDLPNWITYHYNSSDLSRIYNNNAIFISNSLTEGFPLVVLEAMSCGCALVCTDIIGHKESAIDNKTALLVEPKNPDDMVNKVSFLIENNHILKDMALDGNIHVEQYSWNSSVKKMNNLIQEIRYNQD